MLAVTIEGFPTVLAAAQEGAEWAWDVVVREYGADLGRFFAARSLPDPEAVVGEVFLDLARSIRTFDGEESQFRSWVFVIAYRRMADEWRRLQRRPAEQPQGLRTEDDAIEPSAESQALEAIGTRTALGLLDVLTPEQRDVISFRVVSGLSLAETAEVLGKPVSAIKALQRRGIAALRREIEKQGVSE